MSEGRDLSEAATASQAAEETDEVWLALLTIDHTDLETPLRIVRNLEDIVSNDQNFVGLPFEVELPGQSADTPGEARLWVDNVDQRVVLALRQIGLDPPSVRIDVVLADQPDTFELTIDDLRLAEATYDAARVSGVLRFQDILTEPVAEIMTPARFPGAY